MSEGHTVTIHPADAHVEVRLGDEVLASSDRALRLEETGLPARYYLPKADVRMDLLESTTFHTTCPFKGEASYWSVTLDGTRHDGIVWALRDPDRLGRRHRRPPVVLSGPHRDLGDGSPARIAGPRSTTVRAATGMRRRCVGSATNSTNSPTRWCGAP